MRPVAALVCSLMTAACTQTYTEVRHPLPANEFRLKRIPNSSPVRVTSLRMSEGMLRGSLQPSLSCTRVPVQVKKQQTVEVVRSDPAKNSVLLATGVAMVAVSGLVFHSAGGLSGTETCSETHGEDWLGNTEHSTTCSSPRSETRFLAGTGVVLGAAAITAGTVGLLRRPSTKVLDETSTVEEVNGGPDGPVADCLEQEQLAGVELTLETNGSVLGSSVADLQGAFTFAVPQKQFGVLDIVVGAVPHHLRSLLPVGRIVARHTILADEPASIESPPKSESAPQFE